MSIMRIRARAEKSAAMRNCTLQLLYQLTHSKLVPHTLPRGELLLLFPRMVFHEVRVALHHRLHQAKTSLVVHPVGVEIVATCAARCAQIGALRARKVLMREAVRQFFRWRGRWCLRGLAATAWLINSTELHQLCQVLLHSSICYVRG